MGRESYIRAPYVRTRRSLGRPAAAPARLLECRGGARRLDDRRWHFPHARGDRATRPGAGPDAQRGGRGRSARAVRRAHLRGTRGAVPALGWGVRLRARGLRPAPRLPVRLGRAVADPRVGAGGDRDAVRGVLAALARARSDAPTL